MASCEVPDPRGLFAQVDEDSLDSNAVFEAEAQSVKASNGTRDTSSLLRIQCPQSSVFTDSTRFDLDHDELSLAPVLHQQIDFRATHQDVSTQGSVSDRLEMFFGESLSPDALSAISLTIAVGHVMAPE